MYFDLSKIIIFQTVMDSSWNKDAMYSNYFGYRFHFNI